MYHVKKFEKINQNARLYKPSRAQPFLDPGDLRKSAVPLGTLNENLNKYHTYGYTM